MRLLHVSAATIAVTIVLTCSSSFASPEDGLKGSWKVTVSPNPLSLCNGPQIGPAPLPFLELASYAGGGVMTETNTQVNFISASLSPDFPFNGSDGHGTWKRDGPGFSVKFIKLLYDATGNFVGEADIIEEVEVRGDRFTGAFTIELDFLNNSPSVCSSGALSAHRIVAP